MKLNRPGILILSCLIFTACTETRTNQRYLPEISRHSSIQENIINIYRLIENNNLYTANEISNIFRVTLDRYTLQNGTIRYESPRMGSSNFRMTDYHINISLEKNQSSYLRSIVTIVNVRNFNETCQQARNEDLSYLNSLRGPIGIREDESFPARRIITLYRTDGSRRSMQITLEGQSCMISVDLYNIMEGE